jgi:hypothetical protein
MRIERRYYIFGLVVLKVGDKVCILFGSKVPFYLRPIDRSYLLISKCYIYRLIKGKVIGILARDNLYKKTFNII